MPANLPPQYYELERQFNKETDIAEKLRLAKELLAIMPKHKGTDKLQADLKAKISKLKIQLESGGKKHGAHHHGDPFSHIEKEGAGQIILIGPPNSGKSSILDYYTNARPLIADYPFTTHEPMTGMMPFETIQFQLIDTPAIGDLPMPPYLPNLIRQADLMLLVLDVTDSEIDRQLANINDKLKEKNIALSSPEKKGDTDAKYVYKKTLIAAHKYSPPDSDKNLAKIRLKFEGIPILSTSILESELMEKLKRAIFDSLDIIRVYTKRSGHEPDFKDPVVLPKGSTVGDAALRLHKDFALKLQYAKIWGKGKFEGQRVKSNFVLTDEDIVEFHI